MVHGSTKQNISPETLEELSRALTDTFIRDKLQTFPEKFQSYSALSNLYDKAHTSQVSKSGECEFLEFFNDWNTTFQPAKLKQLKQLDKRFSFLLGIASSKAEEWILENVCEQDFFMLLEATICIADKTALDELNNLLGDIYWFPELVGKHLGTVKGFPDYTEKLAQCPFALKFQDRLADPQWVKTMFYKEILPNALRSDDASAHLGLSKDERRAIFDLRYIKNATGFKRMQDEYTQVTGELNGLKVRTTPLGKIMKLKKRHLELEFIWSFLSGIQNPEKYQAQQQKNLSATFLSQRLSHIDFTRSGNLYYLYGAIYRKEMPKISYIPHYSVDYYPEFIIPALKIFKRCL